MRISDWSSDVCSSDLLCSNADAMLLWREQARGKPPSLRPRCQRRYVRACAPRQTSFCRGEEIGRASCRERVCQYVSISGVAVSLKIKNISKRRLHTTSRTKQNNYIKDITYIKK